MRIKHWIELFKKKHEILKQVDQLQNQVNAVLEDSRKERRELNKAISAMEDEIEHFRYQAETLTQTNDRLEHSLNGAMQKLEILEEITIPNLNKLLATYSSAWDYQTAQAAMKTAFIESQERETSND